MTTATSTFGARSTADRVLAGIDLTGKNILVTGCNSGTGFETANALAANGARVIMAAPTLQEAHSAARDVGYNCTPLECDLGDLESIAAAAETVRALQVPLDALVADSGYLNVAPETGRYGVEEHFLVHHLGHFALINELAGMVRDAAGRIVVVTSRAAGMRGGVDDIMFDNLAGQRVYPPTVFHAQAKFANALYAKELSRRLQTRGIAVNSVNPGDVRGAGIGKYLGLARRLGRFIALPFLRTPAQGAATIALLAASPNVNGVTGQYWQDCAIASPNPRLDDGALAARLWSTCEAIIAGHRPSRLQGLARAA